LIGLLAWPYPNSKARPTGIGKGLMKFEIKRFRQTWRVLYAVIIIIIMAVVSKSGGVQNLRVKELKGVLAAEAEYEAIQENPVITQTVIDRAWATYKGAASEGTDGRVLASEYAYPSVLLKYARYVYDKLPDQITDVSHFLKSVHRKSLQMLRSPGNIVRASYSSWKNWHERHPGRLRMEMARCGSLIFS
jgi:hypothetical protein